MKASGLRAIVVVSLFASALVGLVADAQAHRVESFTACRWRPAFHACGEPNPYLARDGVTIRGKVTPPHRNRKADLWRRLPGTGVFEKMREIKIHKHGGILWHWETDEGDANTDASYGFQFRIPGHGRSNKVNVWVIEADI